MFPLHLMLAALIRYHHERNHQGLQNQLIIQPTEQRRDGSIACRERVGGLLKYYHRLAA